MTSNCSSFINFCNHMEISNETISIISPDQKQKWQIKYGEDSKEAKALLQEAKACATRNEYVKAISLVKQAMAKYNSMKAIANKIPNKNTRSGTKFSNGTVSYRGIAKTSTLDWCNRQISNCQALILKYQNQIKKIAKQ